MTHKPRERQRMMLPKIKLRICEFWSRQKGTGSAHASSARQSLVICLCAYVHERVCVWSNDQLMTVMSIPSKPVRGKLLSPWLQAPSLSSRGQGSKVRSVMPRSRRLSPWQQSGKSRKWDGTNGCSSLR